MILEDAKDLIFNSRKIGYVLNGITDPKFDITKAIIRQNLKLSYEEVLARLRGEELELQLCCTNVNADRDITRGVKGNCTYGCSSHGTSRNG